MSVGDVYKLSAVGTLGLGQECVTTYHYQQVTAIVGNNAEALANAWNDACVGAYLDCCSESFVLQSLEVRQVTGSGLEGFDLSVGLAGANAGDPLPPQVCPLISWRSGLIGRRNRGRTYMPAPTENDQVGGTLAAGITAALTAFANTTMLLEYLTVDTFQQVIYGRPNPDVDPPLLENIVPVVSFLVREDLATQRRRRAGVGS